MSSFFQIREHTQPGQHIRDHPKATRITQEDVLRLAIKQYVPISLPHPVPKNAITIINLHANGFPKEMYEPFMELLCKELHAKSIWVRGIWIADVAHQGASSVLNEDVNGTINGWFDHSRDLLLMINTFRDEMPRPLVGIGHSFGCASLVNLSIIHPRLLSTMILCEPIIFHNYQNVANPGMVSVRRQDWWPTRAKAETALRKSFRNVHPTVMSLYLQHGLRKPPTLLYPYDPEHPEAVTLTTSKHAEVWSYAHLNLDPWDPSLDRLLKPDQTSEELVSTSARPEACITFTNLAHVRPSVLYVHGSKSPIAQPEMISRKFEVTGTGVGGSGGAAHGKVASVVIPGATHLLPFEEGHLQTYASTTAKWMEDWFQGWLADEEKIRQHRSREADESGLRMSREYVNAIMRPISTLREGVPPGPGTRKGGGKL